MTTISYEQLEALSLLEGKQVTILHALVAKLFVFSQVDVRWDYTNLAGGLCFVIDRQWGGVPFFRLQDLNHGDILFEYELPQDFHLHQKELNQQFHSFPIYGKFFIGLSFADSLEAITLKEKINSYCLKSSHPKPEEQNINKTLVNKLTNVEAQKGFQQGTELKLENLKFGKPKNFILVNHIGWDGTKECLDFGSLSKEFKSILKKAGIKKGVLKDPSKALFIYEALLNPIDNMKAEKKKNKEQTKPKEEKSKDKESKKKDKDSSRINTENVDENKEEIKKIISSHNTPKQPNPPVSTFGNPPPPPPPNLNLNGPPPPPNLNLGNVNLARSISMSKGPPSLLESKKDPNSKPSSGAPDRSALLEQIRSGDFKLKKVDTSEKKPEKEKFTKQEEMSLVSYLASEISKRRYNLTKNDQPSDDEPDSEDEG